MEVRIREKRRVLWKGMIGTILASGRSEYLVAFNLVCQFVPKNQCELVYGMK